MQRAKDYYYTRSRLDRAIRKFDPDHEIEVGKGSEKTQRG
jgi:hypothetical protein